MSRLDPYLLLLLLPQAVAAEPARRPPPPVIVVDPGHGGKDPGAVSVPRIREKEIVLSISRRLAATLRKKTNATVVLTRNTDRFVSLDRRDAIANAKGCDLFLSIHANASKNRRAEGIEIYYLNKATDEASRRLAVRENEGAPKREKEIERIVSDLIQTAATEESADLARRLQGTLNRRLRKKYGIDRLQVKTALFYVLVGAKCPSLLIETGYVTHPREGRRLRQGKFQKEMAEAIAEAVANHLGRRENEEGEL